MKELKILKEGETGYGALIETDGYTISESRKNLMETINAEVNCCISVDCILQKADTINKNGRIYPYEILKKVVSNYEKLIADFGAFGECDHPETTNMSLINVTHRVSKIWWEGKTVWGTLELDITPGYINRGICSSTGDRIANMLKNGFKLGISSRGVGSVTEQSGQNIVQEDFELICFDLVATPSTPGAYLFPNKEINESTNKDKIEINKNNGFLNTLNDFLGK